MKQNRKRKLLIIINNFLIGGVERSMFDILSRLDRDKFDIEIATVIGSGPLESEFRSLNFPIYLLGQNIDQDRSLFDKVRWVILAPLTLLRLVAIIKRIRPDLVLTSLYQAEILGMCAAKISGVKERIMIQSDAVELPMIRAFFKRSLSLRLSTKIIAISNTVSTFMVKRWRVPISKIKVIYNGIDFEKFNVTREPRDILTLGIVGRLEKIKGVDIFSQAIVKLKQDYSLEPNVLFVGDGSMRKSLEELMDRSQLKKVQFVGFVSNVQEWLTKIDLLVIPSRSEGFGLVMIEGLLTKCLVVASDIPAFKEIIGEKNNMFFPTNDHNALSKLLAELLVDTQKRDLLRKDLDLWIKTQSNRFDIKETVKSYESVLI
ncbi:MAG: Glycosyl transferase group 1 [Microgenomates group bacterium GW2011_GWC1_37_8]|nr:MAG: Glycosyl transferase group 1 [Microgenomates group bacterium GW2011_GWC1_37_8]